MNKILGRFNFSSIRKDCFDVYFRYDESPVMYIIAQNLSKDEAVDLMQDLNEGLQETKYVQSKAD